MPDGSLVQIGNACLPAILKDMSSGKLDADVARKLVAAGVLISTEIADYYRDLSAEISVPFVGSSSLLTLIPDDITGNHWLFLGIAQRAGILPNYASTCNKFPEYLRYYAAAINVGRELYSLRKQSEVSTRPLIDIGTLLPNQDHPLRGQLQRLGPILGRAKGTITVGGDHSITAELVEAQLEPVTVIIFDAHLDMHPPRSSTTYLHDETTARLLELDNVDRIFLVGPRGFLSADKNPFAHPKLEVVHAGRLCDSVAKHQGADRYYISVDFDVIDPAWLPSVTSPAAGGLSPETFLAVIESLAKVLNGKCVGIDFVENSTPLMEELHMDLSLQLIVETMTALAVR